MGCQQIGSSQRFKRTEKLKEDVVKMFTKIKRQEDDNKDDDDKEDDALDKMNFSTKTILGHYANLMRDQQNYVVKG